jgi:predicted Co/Zn/Cd cation transporter (cation efflux family)
MFWCFFLYLLFGFVPNCLNSSLSSSEYVQLSDTITVVVVVVGLLWLLFLGGPSLVLYGFGTESFGFHIRFSP